MKLHNYPWFPADWLTSTTRFEMTEEQRGIYRDLLDHHYEEGSLPTNERALQGKAAASDKVWARSKEVVLSHFYERDGRLYHRKAEQVLAARKEWKEKQRSFGIVGAQKRWGAHGDPNGQPTGNPKATPMHSDTNTNTSTPYPQGGEDEIATIAQAIIDRHPNPQGMKIDAVVREIISQTQPNEDALRVAQEIGRNHAALCGLPEADGGWLGKEPKFIPTLRRWMPQGRDPTRTACDKPKERPRTMEY